MINVTIFAHIMHMQETGLGSGEPTYHNPEELNFHVRELASTYMYEATYEFNIQCHIL